MIAVGYSTSSVTLFLICNFLAQFTTSSALGAGAAATQSLVEPRMRGVATAIYFLGATLLGLALGPFTAIASTRSLSSCCCSRCSGACSSSMERA